MNSLTPSFYVYFRWSYWWSWNSNIYWFATLQTLSFWVYRPLCNCFIMKLINKRKGAKQARLLSKYIKRRSLEHFWTFLFKFVNGVAVFSPCTPIRKISRFSPLLDPSLNKIVFELWLPLPRISNYSLVNWLLSLKGSSQLTIKLSHRGYWPSAVIWWTGAKQMNLWTLRAWSYPNKNEKYRKIRRLF